MKKLSPQKTKLEQSKQDFKTILQDFDNALMFRIRDSDSSMVFMTGQAAESVRNLRMISELYVDDLEEALNGR